METKKNFPVDRVTDIRIKTRLSQVKVVAGNGSDIVLRWTDTKRRTTSAELDGTVLAVKEHAEITLYGVMGLIWLKQDNELTLELPQGFNGIVEIEGNDECVRILGVNCPMTLQVKTLIGAIGVSASDIQSCDLTSQGGAISLRGITSQKGISASTNNGDIECLCEENADSYLLDCHSEHGECNVPAFAGRGGKYLRLRSKTGSITVNFMGEMKERE